MTSILIIEDNYQVRELIKDEVADLVEHLFEGEDGSQAFPLYKLHQPDWVLMDISMKQVDGLTATRQIKAVYPDAHICILTSFNDEYLYTEAKAAGASLYLPKEDLYLLRQLIEQW